MRRWRRRPGGGGGGGGAQSDGWADEAPSRTSQLERRVADRRQGPTERFSFLNLHFFHYAGWKEVKMKDRKGDGGEKDVM